MNRIINERLAAFQYAFLTSRTSKILLRYLKWEDYQLNSESISILHEASNFIKDIISGEQLVSGQKEGLSPSPNDVKLLNYAIHTLSSLQMMQSRSEIKDYFDSIHHTMSDVISKPRKELSSPNITNVYEFFSTLANSFADEVQPSFEKETHTPKKEERRNKNNKEMTSRVIRTVDEYRKMYFPAEYEEQRLAKMSLEELGRHLAENLVIDKKKDQGNNKGARNDHKTRKSDHLRRGRERDGFHI